VDATERRFRIAPASYYSSETPYWTLHELKKTWLGFGVWTFIANAKMDEKQKLIDLVEHLKKGPQYL
jgi:hypothetical protein